MMFDFISASINELIDYGRSVFNPSKPEVATVADDDIKPMPTEKSPLANDAKTLMDYYGLERGAAFEISLQEINKVVPRKRVRTDAYRKLCSYLENEFEIKLTIKSQKS